MSEGHVAGQEAEQKAPPPGIVALYYGSIGTVLLLGFFAEQWLQEPKEGWHLPAIDGDGGWRQPPRGSRGGGLLHERVASTGSCDIGSISLSEFREGERQSLDRMKQDEENYKSFFDIHFSLKRPVKVSAANDIVDFDFRYRRWTREGLLKWHARHTAKVGYGNGDIVFSQVADGVEKVRLGPFLKEMQNIPVSSRPETAKLQVFDRSEFLQDTSLLEGFLFPLAVQRASRGAYDAYAIIQPHGSGTNFQAHTEVFHHQIFGQTLWFVYPPGHRPPNYYGSASMSNETLLDWADKTLSVLRPDDRPLA